MASLTDIALDIQNTLSAIQTNTANTESAVLQVKADTGALNMQMGTLISVNQNGFFNLSQGIGEVIKQQFATNQQLKHQSAQNEVIICWLRTIANLLCDIKRQLEASHEVQKKIAECLCLLEEIMELVHGTEAVQVHAHQDLEDRIKKCCPPPRPEPKPCFDPCAEPPRPPDIPNPDFTPLPRPQDQPGTPGTVPSRPPG
jgi:hypothetical protein